MLTKVPIKHFAKVGSGQGAPQRETDFSETGIPFIRAGSLEDLLNGMDEYELPKVNEEIAKEYRLKLYQPNTIVFAKSGMSALKGRIYKLKNPCYVVNHLATLELKENAIPDYVIYTLRYFSPVKLINDNAYPSLKQSVIENYELPFPKDKDVQLHIANLLSKAENLIAQRKESIRLLDEFLSSTFLEMFGDPVRNEKGWKTKPLNQLVDKLGDGLHGTPVYDDNGEYFFINGNNLEKGFIRTDVKTKRVSYEEYIKHTKELNENTILVSINGTLGRVAFYRGEKIILGKSACYFNLIKGSIDSLFLFHFLQSEFFLKYVSKKATGSTISNVSLKTMRELPIIIPPPILQTQFAQIVEKTEVLKTQYQQSLQELENLYGSLSQKAFNGELSLK